MSAEQAGMSWTELAVLVDAGELHLDRGASTRCAQHCRDLANELADLQRRAVRLGTVDGLGTLPSGVALAAKFGRKATGGAYSMDRALADHIEVVNQMRHVFEKIEERYRAADESAAAAISGSGSGS